MTPDVATSDSFPQTAEQTLRRLRGCVIEILSGLGLSNERPQDVARALKLDKSLAWKIAKIAQTTDPFATFQHLPGSTGFDIFFNRAEQRGVPAEVIERAKDTMNALEDLRRVHAGDRATFEIMLSAFAKQGQHESLIAHRKQLFQGASSVWGIQADTDFLCLLLHPREDDDTRYDLVSIKGFVDLIRLRPDVPWCLCKSRCESDDGEAIAQQRARQPLDPDYLHANTAPLLPQFCSTPLPNLRRVRAEKDFFFDELVEGPIGNTGAVTCVTGEVLRNVFESRRSAHNQRAHYSHNVFTPVEWLIFDLIVHESLLPLMPPEIMMYSRLGGEPDSISYGSRRVPLPLTETAEDLGQPPIVQIPSVPRYQEMVDYGFEQMGWDSNQFRGYRAAIQYPALSSLVVLEHDLFEQ